MGKLDIFSVKFTAEVMAMMFEGNFANGARAIERIENDIPRPAASEDARFDEIGREGSKMRAFVGAGGDGPDIALVAGWDAVYFVAEQIAFGIVVSRMSFETTARDSVGGLGGRAMILHIGNLRFGCVAADGFGGFAAIAFGGMFLSDGRHFARPAFVPNNRKRLRSLIGGSKTVFVFFRAFHYGIFAAIVVGDFEDGFVIVVIARGFGEHENVFVRLGATVGDGFWHGIGFLPDDVLAEEPAIGAESEGDHPGNADEVFGFDDWMLAVGGARFPFSADLMI